MDAIKKVNLQCLFQLNASVHFIYAYAPMCFQMVKHISGGERGGREGRIYNE
jgi:hypothetical protein